MSSGQLQASAASILSAVHPAPPAFAPALHGRHGFSASEELLIRASDEADALRLNAAAAKWTAAAAKASKGQKSGTRALEGDRLLLAIDEAKRDLVANKSRAALLEQIGDSMDLASLINSMHTDASHPLHISSAGGAELHTRVKTRDELALAHLKACLKLAALEQERVVVTQEMSDLRQECQNLFNEIKRTSALQSDAARQGITEKQTAQLAAYKGRTKAAVARREVARNVLQALIVESGFDWAGDAELREVMLALGDDSAPWTESKEAGLGEPPRPPSPDSGDARPSQATP